MLINPPRNFRESVASTYFYYDLAEWLREHGDKLEEGVRAQVRNKDWFHMYNADVISMPDKWEYPWYAVWDLAFHSVPLSSTRS